MTMATVEFRPPQFSEESVWAPCWLQEIKANPFNEQRIESSTPYEKAAKEIFEVAIEEQIDANFLTSDMRFNRFHLFLSEQDSLQNSYTSPFENVLHLHLHLSANDSSQHCSSQLMNQSQIVMESGDVILKPLLQAEVVEHVIPQSPINVKSNLSTYEDKFIVRHHQVDDIKDVVELSVAASEALVIHELIKSESTVKALPAEALLDVSLRVKNARLEMSKDFVLMQTEQAYQSDSLSDLDDFLMADAYDDVGVPQHTMKDQYTNGMIMSQVQDTPIIESHSGSGNHFGSADIKIQETNSEIYSRRHYLEKISRADVQLAKHLLLDSTSYNAPNQISDNHVLAPIPCDIAENGDFMFSQLAKKKSDVVAVPQSSEFQIHHISGNSSQYNDKSIAFEMKQRVVGLSLERFKSRWLGGWTGELDVAEKVPQWTRKTVPKPFVAETSFISESPDNPPDEHSFIQNFGKQYKIASQSSPPLNSQINKIDSGMLLTQDFVRSSLSLADPLCSFVPCSISSENMCSTHVKILNEGGNDTTQFFNDFPEHKVDNLSRTGDFEVEIRHQCESKSFLADCEDLGYPIRREGTSLKSYSVLFSNHASLYGSGRLDNHKNQLQSDLGSLPIHGGSARARYPYPTSLKQSALQSLSCFDTMDNRETTDKLNQVVAKTKKKMNSTGSIERQNFLVDSGPFLNHRRLCQLQIDKCFIKTFGLPGEKKPEPASVDNIHHFKNLQKTPFGDTSQKIDVLNRKRVHFSKSEVQVQDDKDLHKLLPSNKYRSNKTNKRTKCSNQGVNPQIQDCNTCLIKCCGGIEKRLIFHGIDFLLTGFSSKKERDIEELIRKYGGMTLLDIPPRASRKKSSKSSANKLPIILCSKKLRSIKFLYGCAVNAFILHVDWLTDSIAECSVLPPGKYTVIPNQADWSKIRKRQSEGKRRYIFEKVGIMLNGKHSFCTKLAKIFNHGGGQVFKNLQQLVKSVNNGKLSVGFIVAQDAAGVSRHLKQCALEQGISLLPANWIIKSLHLGKLLPVAQESHPSPLPTIQILKAPIDAEISQQAMA